MPRNRKSAKAAGSRFEREVAEALAHALDDDRIERRARNGNRDRGDIAGLRIHGQRIVVEAKNCARINLAGWAAEADIERGNDDALAGVIAHKRHGTGNPLDQWITMTVREFAALIAGHRTEDHEETQ